MIPTLVEVAILVGMSACNPILEDLARFPPADVVDAALLFNRSMFSYMEVLPYEKGYLALTCLQARDWLNDAHYSWWLLHEAQQENCGEYDDSGEDRTYPDYRQRMLSKLRETIGNEAYYAGRMPPQVPTRLLQAIRY